MEQATILGLYGALTGTLSLIYCIRSQFRDSSKLQVELSLFPTIVESDAKYYVRLDVVNHGRRVLRITRAGLRLPDAPRILIMWEGNLTLAEAERQTLIYEIMPLGTISIEERKITAVVVDSLNCKHEATTIAPNLSHQRAIIGLSNKQSD